MIDCNDCRFLTTKVIPNRVRAYWRTKYTCQKYGYDTRITTDEYGNKTQSPCLSCLEGKGKPEAVLRERTPVGDYRCPMCRAAFIDGLGETNYCCNCGQRLAWPEQSNLEDRP